jgi:hypothetical protein
MSVLAEVSSLVERPESHDEDGRDSIEDGIAERGGQLGVGMGFISCWKG